MKQNLPGIHSNYCTQANVTGQGNQRDPRKSRTNTRFRVREDILAYNQSTFAEIIDISEEGISCRYLVNLRDKEPTVTSLDLLNGTDQLYVKGVPCITVYSHDEIVSPSIPSTVLRTCGFKFAEMDREKREALKGFIDKSRIESFRTPI